MLTPEDRRAHYAVLEDGFRIRARNLRRIIEACGGWEAASRRTGKSVAKLKQIADIWHPWHQTIGDKLARELEFILHLKSGDLDRKTPRIP